MKVDIPKYWVVEAEDSHDFDYALKNYMEIFNDIDFEECGYDSDYYAIFWIGKKTKEVQLAIDKLKKKREGKK